MRRKRQRTLIKKDETTSPEIRKIVLLSINKWIEINLRLIWGRPRFSLLTWLWHQLREFMQSRNVLQVHGKLLRCTKSLSMMLGRSELKSRDHKALIKLFSVNINDHLAPSAPHTIQLILIKLSDWWKCSWDRKNSFYGSRRKTAGKANHCWCCEMLWKINSFGRATSTELQKALMGLESWVLYAERDKATARAFDPFFYQTNKLLHRKRRFMIVFGPFLFSFVI